MQMKQEDKSDIGEVSDQNINMEILSKVIKELTDNYHSLPISKQLSVVNLLLKVAITRDGSKLVVPTMEDPNVRQYNEKR